MRADTRARVVPRLGAPRYRVDMFAVLYRWKLKPGTESTFREAWRAVTETIKAERGGFGSRLHRTAEGELVAYAVWPSRERWEVAGTLPSTNEGAAARMKACIEQSMPSTPLDVIDDLIHDPRLDDDHTPDLP